MLFVKNKQDKINFLRINKIKNKIKMKEMRPAVLRHMKNLETFIEDYMNITDFKELLNEPFVRFLNNTVKPIFLEEPNIIEVDGPVHVCGDIHGRLSDLINIFKMGGNPAKTKYVFLGDYVDRGKKSLEVISLLFAMKIKYPSNITLLRGNHETKEMTKEFGFSRELKKKLGKGFTKIFCDTFNAMPISAIINHRIFCVHGGISPELHDISQINEIDRFHELPETGLFSDLLWADPDPSVEEFGPSERGETFVFGEKPLVSFLRDNGFDILIRGHQVALEGYNYPFGSKHIILTIFSCSSHDNDEPNAAAFATVDSDSESYVYVTQLPYLEKSKSQTTRRKRK